MKLSKAVIRGSLGLALIIGFTGCNPARIQAQFRKPDLNSNMQTRCEEIDMRDNSEMEEVFEKYDGWRMIFVSEYTTSNLFGTSASVCFERPYATSTQRAGVKAQKQADKLNTGNSTQKQADKLNDTVSTKK